MHTQVSLNGFSDFDILLLRTSVYDNFKTHTD